MYSFIICRWWRSNCGYKNWNLLLIVLEARKSEIKVPASPVFANEPVLHRWHSMNLLVAEEEKDNEFAWTFVTQGSTFWYHKLRIQGSAYEPGVTHTLKPQHPINCHRCLCTAMNWHHRNVSRWVSNVLFHIYNLFSESKDHFVFTAVSCLSKITLPLLFSFVMFVF